MIDIGTNILYNGKNFLDLRQGKADSLADLKTWSLNIPTGFEVCVGGVWYVYNPEFEEDEITGKFRKRIDVELGASVDVSGMQGQISELMDAVFPLSLSISGGGGTYETGSTITPHLTWSVSRKGVAVNPTSATVNNSTEGVGSDKKSWTGSPITTTTTYTVKVGYQGLEKSGTASFTFRLHKYFGVSAKTSLTNSDILAFSNAWATGWTDNARTYDCTGGKYPYYIIPSSQYDPSTFKCWVGGLRNTDLVVTTQTVTNSSGYTTSYAVIRLGTLQTGVLSIRFGD